MTPVFPYLSPQNTSSSLEWLLTSEEENLKERNSCSTENSVTQTLNQPSSEEELSSDPTENFSNIIGIQLPKVGTVRRKSKKTKKEPTQVLNEVCNKVSSLSKTLFGFPIKIDFRYVEGIYHLYFSWAAPSESKEYKEDLGKLKESSICREQSTDVQCEEKFFQHITALIRERIELWNIDFHALNLGIEGWGTEKELGALERICRVAEKIIEKIEGRKVIISYTELSSCYLDATLDNPPTLVYPIHVSWVIPAGKNKKPMQFPIGVLNKDMLGPDLGYLEHQFLAKELVKRVDMLFGKEDLRGKLPSLISNKRQKKGSLNEGVL